MKIDDLGAVAIYRFELPGSEIVLLKVERRMDGNVVMLTVPGRPEVSRPSDVGASGFDSWWEAGDRQAYGVEPERVEQLVTALSQRETA